MRSSEARIKGFAIRGLLKFVKESGHEGGIPAVLNRLPPEVQLYFKDAILSSLWYPYPAFGVLLRTIDRELGEGDLEIVTEIGRFAARQDAGSIFRFISSILSLDRMVRRSPIFWQRYCDTGALEVVEAVPGRLLVQLRGFGEIDEAHCRLILGWILGLGELQGARQPRVEKTACVHRGDQHCEYSGTWKA